MSNLLRDEISKVRAVCVHSLSQDVLAATIADFDATSWAATISPDGAEPSIGPGDAPTVTFDMAGDYVFTVTVSDGRGGSAKQSLNVTVVQTSSDLLVRP